MTLVKNELGEPLYYLGQMEDITERKRAEASLRENEQRYRSLYAAAERQTQELALLDRVRTALARELDLPLVFQTVVEAIADTFGYALVSLYLLQDDTLVLQHQVGYKTQIDAIPILAGNISLKLEIT